MIIIMVTISEKVKPNWFDKSVFVLAPLSLTFEIKFAYNELTPRGGGKEFRSSLNYRASYIRPSRFCDIYRYAPIRKCKSI